MRKIVLLFLIISLLLAGCSSTPGQKGTSDATGASAEVTNGTNANASVTSAGAIKFYPTYDPGYKTANNEIFDFWFDIPSDWTAKDNSKDGSVYDILSGNKNVKIKIYGQMKEGSENAYYASLAGKSGTAEDFTYRDGWVGKQIKVSDNEEYYVRVDGDSYLVLHVDANGDPEWKKENEDILSYIAGSARTTREGYGLGLSDDDNRITPDDLQLGNIKLDMTYDELVKQVGQKPEKEEADENEGLNAKTLFFADGTQVYMVDNTVYSVNVTSPDYPTPKGLKTGDSESKLRELYGEPSSSEDGVMGYSYNGYDLFTVVIENGKVSQIQIDKGSWDVEVF